MVNLQVDECLGCLACMKVCPVDAINILKDGKNNEYTRVNLDKCIRCNKCEKVCPVVSPVKFLTPRVVYAAKARKVDIIKETSSGGAAYLFARKFIEQGGVVFGCKSTTLTQFEHVEVGCVDSLMSLSGSKYVKSDISKALTKIYQRLKDGFKVLFIGTPCQVAAVINLTGGSNNLYCIDLVCHGVPTKDFFDRYAHETLGDLFDQCLYSEFRKKTPKIKFGTWFVNPNSGKTIKSQPYPKSPYMAAFFAGVSYRENCHKCNYARIERVSDITLGDFWGINSQVFDENKGVSLIMCNTQKGSMMFDSIIEQIEYEAHSIDEAAAHNANLRAPFKRPVNKDLFYDNLKGHTIEYAVKKTLPTYRKANNIFYRIYLTIAVLFHKYLKRR